jgi:hypothetical protein
VTINNIQPGQKIKVTVVEGGKIATPSTPVTVNPKPSSKPTSAANIFKVTTNNPVKVVPTPSGSKAGVGITNLKPGQKIKVTVKTGGTTK